MRLETFDIIVIDAPNLIQSACAFHCARTRDDVHHSADVT